MFMFLVRKSQIVSAMEIYQLQKWILETLGWICKQLSELNGLRMNSWLQKKQVLLL